MAEEACPIELVVEGPPEFLECTKTGLRVVNPVVVVNVDANQLKNTKTVIWKRGDAISCVIIKWKGNVNNNLCIGCELDMDHDHGTNGTFNGHHFFDSADLRGVLVPVNESTLVCCATGNGDSVIEINDKKFIMETCICCVESTAVLTGGSKINTGDKVVLDDISSGRCAWIGMINGVECLGLDMDNFSEGTDGIFNKIPVFECRPKSGVLIKFDDIPKVLACEHITLDIVNPTNIGAILTKENINKYVIQINGERTFVLKLLWTGTVDNIECVGCILPFDYEYGTDGTFVQQRMFRCADKRGVLARTAGPLGGCVTGLGHKTLVHTTSNAIDTSSICCIVFVQRLDAWPQLKTGDPVMVKCNNRNIYSLCKWLGRVNGEEAVGIEKFCYDERGTDGRFYDIKLFACKNGNGFIYRAVDIKCDVRKDEEMEFRKGTTYYESTVIQPSSVVAIRALDFEEWTKGGAVEFRLFESYLKYDGVLRWTGLVNGIFSAAVELNEVAETDPILNYVCPEDIKERMAIYGQSHIVIVVLISLNKFHVIEDSINIFKRIIRSNSLTVEVDVLMDIIRIKDSRAVNSILREWKSPIDLVLHPYVLITLIDESKFDIIAILLEHFVVTDKDNIHLLSIAQHFLMQRDYEVFTATSRKCPDANILLANGETFLTNVIKYNDDEELINTVIDADIFDVNKANEQDDTPLVLAAGKLLVSTVQLLVTNGASKSHRNNLSLTVAFNICKTINDPEKLHKALEIIEILTRDIRLDANPPT